MQDWLSLDRRPAFVFSAGGLGGASALSLATQGARVALADASQDNLDAVGQAAKDLAGEIWTLTVDLRTAAGCRAAVQEASELVDRPPGLPPRGRPQCAQARAGA